MRRQSPIQHVGIALAIIVVSYLLFTLFPDILPHPEDFGPPAYLIAFLFILFAWLSIKDRREKWLYFIVLVICLLAFLDESGYGAEVFGYKPYFSQTYHREIRDLHNLTGLGIELVQLKLEELRWNGAMFGAFVKLDFLLLLSGLLFGSILRFRMESGKESAWKQRALWLAAAFTLAAGVAATGYLLLLPRDPRNAWLLGLSLTRLISILGMMLASVLPIFLFNNMRQSKSKRQAFLRRMDIFFDKRRQGLVSFILVGGLAYQIYAPFLPAPDQVTRLERITPITMWLVATAFFYSMAILAAQGRLRTPLLQNIQDAVSTLRRHPAFFYLGVSLTLIVVAQMIDRGWLPGIERVNFSSLGDRDWPQWTEEVFETTAAFVFMAASVFFPKHSLAQKTSRARK